MARGGLRTVAMAMLLGAPLPASAGQATLPAAPPLASGAAPPATSAEAPPIDTVESLQADLDRAGRMTVPVYVNGKGPFPFTIDTGADHTVVSDSLARVLTLPPGRSATLHDITGAVQVQTAIVGQLKVGSREIANLSPAVLIRGNLGAVGMLGIDSVADQRIVLDFKTNRMSLYASPRKREAEEPGTIVVRGKRQFGQLVLIDSHFRGTKVYVIVDTGAQTSIGNSAFRRLVTRKVTPETIDLISVTGRTAPGNQVELPDMELGGVTLRDVPMTFSDIHTFKVFGLETRPAMLLGMDVMRAFERVSVDFAQKKARFVMAPGGPPGGRIGDVTSIRF